jgi:signal transduction histidine kinase
MAWPELHVQATVVGMTVSVAGAAMAAYLWTQNRDERYLLFWAGAWIAGAVRWLIHFPADTTPVLRMLEGGLLIPLVLIFMVLGCYDLLPAKPWRRWQVVVATGGVVLVWGMAANRLNMPLEMGYGLFAAALSFCAACMWIAYRASGLTGFAFAAATFLYQVAFVGFGLVLLGGAISDSPLGPLFNIPLTLSLVVIAYQRQQRQLRESERTLQKIFDNAPTPILLARPPRGEIERANALAFDMLGLPPAAIGSSLVDHGVMQDGAPRQQMVADLAAGRRIIGREVVINRAGDPRSIMVNADRVEVAAGTRFSFSFYDLTDLRRAEAELQAAAEEQRRLYLRLGTVEEDERRALHRELHDRIGANLSALRLELDLVRSSLRREDRDDALRHLDSTVQVTRETIAMSRDLMAELRPPALDDYGLVAALRSFAEARAAKLDLAIEVHGEDLVPRLDPFVETALFRIAQEAFANALEHASASRIRMSVMEEGSVVRVAIEDDGAGFDASVPVAAGHWGLKHMDERARAIRARLHIESAPGAGTRVDVELRRADL